MRRTLTSLPEIEESRASIVPSILPDGRKSISVYNGDVLEGFIVEEPNGEPSVWDANGKPIDLADIADDHDNESKSNIERRASRLSILTRFASFIRRFGTRAWNFFNCVGFGIALNCADDILECAKLGGPHEIGDCLEVIYCAGKSFRGCRF